MEQVQKQSYSKCCRYVIDKKDEIIEVGDNWDRFARANHGENILAENTLNRQLWDFIAGDETRMIYRNLIHKVRSENIVMQFPFRCDGLACRRFMQMRIRALANSALEFFSCIETEEPRQTLRLLDPQEKRNEDLLVVCSWCKDIKCDDEWLPADKAVRRLDLFGFVRLPTISHGICPACETAMEKRLAC